MATIKWFNSINGFSVGDDLTEVIDTSGNVFTSKITSYIDVDIVTDNGNKIWNFDNTGNIVFPDSTTQTTAYPGTANTLSLTGNISAGNANLGNLTRSNYFHGVFDSTSSSQPNITSVGNLSNLFVGNSTANVILLDGNVNATGAINANNFNGNFSGNFSGNVDVSGNIKIGGSNTQVLFNSNGDVQGSNAFIFDYASNIVTLTGNLLTTNANLGNAARANYFIGAGNNLSNISGSNVSGQVANSLVAGTVYTNAQPNITSVGTLTSLAVTANITAGNVLTNSLLYANGSPWDLGGTPAGSNTQIQFNNDNEFGASANLTFDSNTSTLTTTNISAANGVISGNSINGKNALQVGVTGFTSVPNTIVQFTSNLNSATQINFQNINTGVAASTDLVLTSDNGTSTNNYINMGITGSAWDGSQTNSLGNAVVADDGYVYIRGGNLVLGTSRNTTSVKFVVGGPGTGNLVATINKTNVNITGDIIASGNANITGNITSNAGLLTLSTGTLAVSSGDAGIFTTGINNINFGLAANVTIGSTTGNVTARGNLLVPDTAIITNLKVSDVYSNRTPISVTSNTVIDSFPVIKYRSAKYTMRVNSDDGYQAVEVLLIHDSANSYVTIYGSLSTVGFDIIALSTDILSGNVRMLASTGSANTTVNLLGVYVAD